MVTFAEFLLIFNANENMIHVLENHYQKASSHSDAGVRYSHLIPHTLPYRPTSFFFQYSTVPGRDGTVLIPHTTGLWC
jgi:hypothetical protein